MLRTAVQHIAEQVANAVKAYPTGKESASILITGGGAFNQFLLLKLQEVLMPMNVSIHIPDATVIQYKEALIMALIGALRWREETNIMSSVTGASRDTISGALWLGDSYN